MRGKKKTKQKIVRRRGGGVGRGEGLLVVTHRCLSATFVTSKAMHGRGCGECQWAPAVGAGGWHASRFGMILCFVFFFYLATHRSEPPTCRGCTATEEQKRARCGMRGVREVARRRPNERQSHTTRTRTNADAAATGGAAQSRHARERAKDRNGEHARRGHVFRRFARARAPPPRCLRACFGLWHADIACKARRSADRRHRRSLAFSTTTTTTQRDSRSCLFSCGTANCCCRVVVVRSREGLPGDMEATRALVLLFFFCIAGARARVRWMAHCRQRRKLLGRQSREDAIQQ